MTRFQQRIRLVAVSLMALLLLMPNAPSYAQSAEHPNVVLIFSDDQGYGDVSAYGSEIATPHIDAIARDGAKFTSWYDAASICTPSRYALLTGRIPNRAQTLPKDHALMPTRPEDYQKRLAEEEVTLASLLKQRGYNTAILGKWHLGLGMGGEENLPTRHGFDTFYGFTAGCIDYFSLQYGVLPDWWRDDEIIPESGYATDVLTNAAVQYIGDQSSDQPFFLYLPYNAPHYGKGWDEDNGGFQNILQAKDEDLDAFQNIDDETRRTYAAMVKALDDGIGRVLEALDEAGLRENTWVIFISDNGASPEHGGSNEPLRGEKATLWEGGIRVPAVMRWPGHIDPGSEIDQPLSSLDVLPTLTSLLDIDTSNLTLDGTDIRSTIFEGEPVERTLFWDARGSQALRQGPWKYLKREDDDTPMLFNLEEDISEQNNLADAHPDVLQRLQRLHREQQQALKKAQ